MMPLYIYRGSGLVLCLLKTYSLPLQSINLTRPLIVVTEKFEMMAMNYRVVSETKAFAQKMRPKTSIL